jgi:hypothetical protein
MLTFGMNNRWFLWIKEVEATKKSDLWDSFDRSTGHHLIYQLI